ncbi:MAG: protein jag [Sulfurovum sp.]|nr:MAG: protein jag [Sulfurovum sp.]
MTKVEAPTLEEAYAKAAKVLGCSISDLQYEVVQHPSKGFLGLFPKNAIIVAVCKNISDDKNSESAPHIPTPQESVAEEIIEALKEEKAPEPTKDPVVESDPIVNRFFEEEQSEDHESVVYDELALLIETQLKELIESSCFDIDVVEVDVRDDTALVFIDGEDAALLIGKEGYRYNALSYMLFNWLHTKYELYIKLEIAEFYTSQQEMIRNYIKPVIENVEKFGKGKTRYLDGILVQIALEQLREAFPDKYVAVKTSRDGKKFVVINDFNKKSHA